MTKRWVKVSDWDVRWLSTLIGFNRLIGVIRDFLPDKSSSQYWWSFFETTTLINCRISLRATQLCLISTEREQGSRCVRTRTRTVNSEQVGQRRQRKRSTSNIELTFTMNSPSNDCARQWTRLLRHARAFYFGLFPPLVFFSSTSNCVFIWTGERERRSQK